MKYRFYPAADVAQDLIWRYTKKSWGEDQADKYITELHNHVARLADDRNLWLRLPKELVVPADLEMEAYFSKYEHHYIFFRELPDCVIGVMSILHEKMDIPVRLNHDLAKLASQK